ncbi:hypothetical protein ACFE04_028332 [Oxalis oulophora]
MHVHQSPIRTQSENKEVLFDSELDDEEAELLKNVQIVVNEYSQLVGAAGRICYTVMRYIVEEPNLYPIDVKNWCEAKQISGVNLLGELRLLEALNYIETPSNLTEHQWAKVKVNLMSFDAQDLSRKGKVARASHLHSRITGCTSFAQKKYEFKMVHKREPHAIEFFDITHVKKDGSYVQHDSKELMNVAKDKISQKLENLEPSMRVDTTKRVAIEKEVMMELMGYDKPGYARGHGIGVTKRKLTNYNIGLRKVLNVQVQIIPMPY